jgi:putative DNA methylase
MSMIDTVRNRKGAQAYADAIATYLAFAVDKMTLTNCSICTWQTDPPRLTQAYSRQAIPMTWDYAEAYTIGGAGKRIEAQTNLDI